MGTEFNLAKAKEKAQLMLENEYQEQFNEWFDTDGYPDVIENPDDYLAEALVQQFYMEVLNKDNEL